MSTHSTREARRVAESAVFALCLLAVGGCLSGRTLRPAAFDTWGRDWHANVLSGDGLSVYTRATLGLNGLDELQREDSAAACKCLEDLARQRRDRDLLLALAEVRLARSDEGAGLAAPELIQAARAAYATLFDPTIGDPLSPYDPRFALAASFYNAAVARYFQTPNPLAPSDDLTISNALPATLADIREVHPSFAYNIGHFVRRNVRGGLGAPLVTASADGLLHPGAGDLHPPIRVMAVQPATAFLRFDLPLRGDGAPARSVLELLDPVTTPHLALAGREVPVAADFTAPLGLVFDRRSRLRADQVVHKTRFLDGNYMADARGLYLMHPYRRGVVPVIFVHGLMDTALTWFPMINDLFADPRTMAEYQPWAFFYSTANPVPQSAAEFRAALASVRDILDPTHSDPALDNIVLVGHSMGGLLSRMQITTSDNPFTASVSNLADRAGVPVDQVRDYCERVGRFTPSPSVKRVVFIGTPHRGAGMAEQVSGRMGSALTTIPKYVQDTLKAEGASQLADNLPNSIDNLRIGSPFMMALDAMPIATNVICHSIIANNSGTRPEGSDDIVPYWSAHLARAVSEVVVHAHHIDMHEQPVVVQEVARILRLHAAGK